MNGLPDQEPENPQTPEIDSGDTADGAAQVPETPAEPVLETSLPAPLEEQQTPAIVPEPAGAPEQPMFQQWYVEPPRPPARIPHMGHVGILMIFILSGLFAAGILLQLALRFHLFGVNSLTSAINDIHFTLGSEIIVYAIMFAASILFFPMIWHEGFFKGIQWNGATALRLRRQLFFTAAVCFVLAIVNGLLLPTPKNAPIDKIFRTPGAAWLLFGFGITIAPFFEEMIFRGFILPSMCTAFDWIAEKMSYGDFQPIHNDGRPQWPIAVSIKVCLILALPPVTIAIGYHYFQGLGQLIFVLVCLLIPTLLLAYLAILRSKAPKLELKFEGNGHPIWSLPGVIVGSVLTSIPFAAMHAAQTGYSWGPFVLLVGVSLVLCWARLSTRSLAASVLVHSSYNFLLFSLMLLGTAGFRHMDKL